ncbi:MAG: DNA polymerase I [Chlamydiae bacterium]|nr:DNA polymerase I [Chlamydiota bacterium]
MTLQTDFRKLFVVDAANYLFRSYFAIRKMTNPKGASTNALFGFIRSIQKIIKDFKPDHLVCVFDGPNNKKTRLAIYKDYKAHRTGMPEDLLPQLGLAKEYLDFAGIPYLQIEEVEADDTIGSIAKWGETQNLDTYLCSSDKDLCQLVNDHIFVVNTFKENLIIDKKEVENIYGIAPEQIIDYLAIMGDTSDNIPGVSGCGPKTASELLKKFKSLSSILEKPEILESKKLIEKFTREKENALISQKLATIQTNVPIPFEIPFYTIKDANVDKLKSFFIEMDFQTLLKETTPLQPVEKTYSYTLIEDESSLEKMVEELQVKKEIVIDTETTSIEPMLASIVGIGLAAELEKIYYIPLNHKIPKDRVLLKLKPLLESSLISFIGHNIKYDMHALLNHGIALKNVSFDTMLASYILNAHSNRHNLDTLTLEKYQHTKIPIENLIGKKGQISMMDVPPKMVLDYCGEDVYYTLKLKMSFENELKERALWNLFTTLEMPLLPVLFKMERRGIYLDTETLAKLSSEFHKELDHLIRQIYEISKEEFNINSPKQLSAILFEKLQIPPPGKKTQSGYSTNAEVLESLSGDYPIIDLILEYRTLEKLRSTYIDALPLQINPITKRIHTTFNQSGTVTGRLSSTNPNLQNIPIRKAEGKKIREAFKSQEGSSFISLDYSQIELRLLAHFSEDPHLIAAFKNDEDIHKSCASLVFDVPLDLVTDEMRFKAKAVNFGLIYGQQAFGLSKQLGISVKEASLFIERYFKMYPTVKNFLELCKESARRTGKATTLFGRERLLEEITSKNGMLRSQAERLAVNAPIQGTQADIIKLAMIAIDKKLFEAQSKTYLILQIHDELIFECPDDSLKESSEMIASIMEEIVVLKVPLKVDISFGKNWGEC